MRTVDRRIIRAVAGAVYAHASAVENWPRILSHYRRVTRESGEPGGAGVVRMAAYRPFGPLRWPVWWKSAMTTDPERFEIGYRHIGGITKGMDVLWRIDPTPEGWSDVTIVHEWDGPRWPIIGPAAARIVIGPVFVHGIASRTLAGIDAVVSREQTVVSRES
jgi:hypothetical protein